MRDWKGSRITEDSSWKVLLDCDDILDFLKDKFEPSKQTYVFNEITEKKRYKKSSG